MKQDSAHAEVVCLQIQCCEFKPCVVYHGKYRHGVFHLNLATHRPKTEETV